MAKVRVQLDLSEAEAAALDTLRDECGLRSRADAVKAALAVLGWVETQASAGRKVVALHGSNVSWLVVPGVTDQWPTQSTQTVANKLKV